MAAIEEMMILENLINCFYWKIGPVDIQGLCPGTIGIFNMTAIAEVERKHNIIKDRQSQDKYGVSSVIYICMRSA